MIIILFSSSLDKNILSTRHYQKFFSVFFFIPLISGSYSITIDGEQGTVTITGRVNPNSLMVVLEKYGKHGDLKYVKFDGEIKEIRPYNNYNYFGQHEFPSYGRLNPTFPPPFAYPLNQMNEANLRLFPRPMAPPPRPPPQLGHFEWHHRFLLLWCHHFGQWNSQSRVHLVVFQKDLKMLRKKNRRKTISIVHWCKKYMWTSFLSNYTCSFHALYET